MMSRRSFLIGTSALGVVAALGGTAFAQERFEVVHSPAEWRKILPEDAYFVMREEQTEPPGYSPLDREKRAGVFSCAGCDLPVFGSDTKFDSGTAGRASGCRSMRKHLGPRHRAPAVSCRPKCIAAAAEAILVTSFPMAPNPPGSATASTASR